MSTLPMQPEADVSATPAAPRIASDITAADLAPTFAETERGILVNADRTLRVTIDNEDGCVVLAAEPLTWAVTFSNSTPAAVVFAAIEAAS